MIAAAVTAAFNWPAQTDISAKAGIAFRHCASHTSEKYLLETMGSGVALLDFDGDGWLDIFFVNGAALRPWTKATRVTGTVFTGIAVTGHSRT